MKPDFGEKNAKNPQSQCMHYCIGV